MIIKLLIRIEICMCYTVKRNLKIGIYHLLRRNSKWLEEYIM